MKANMGTVDRIIRLVIAAVIALLFFTGKLNGTEGIVLMGVAVVLTITFVMRFCPIYLSFGLNSN
ncbi:MAG: DUF2892 domain-containing protein, partial [Flavobacteriales bacterium]